MLIQKLHDSWNMYAVNNGTGEYLRAEVPGSVYADLLANGKMDDPFWRDNEDAAFALMENDYEYVNTFTVSDAMLNHARVVLRCNGLDTLADVYLNDKHLGKTANMHRVWEFDVKRFLRKDTNSLKIVFHSPNKFVREAYKKASTDGSSDCLDGFPQLRKAHCMFGWDWGPRLPDAGIWRDIELVGIEAARIESVYITQKHREKARVELNFDVEIETDLENEISDYNYEVFVTAPDGTVTKTGDSPEDIIIEKAELWWPHGYGKQSLYTIKVVLSVNGKEIDAWERRIGLRTLTVHRGKDKWGEGFAFDINGVQIFAMGADYIPEDNLLARVTPERTRTLLEQCTAANFNTIRVWGGGYYPDDFFFDACDELGLIVWQDFMFACAVYNLTDDFEANITAEFIDNIKRIRHHAGLGLWCGNNEMEGFISSGTWGNLRQKADYIKIFEYIIPKVLKEYDPATFYWPSSPSSGGSFDEPQDPNRGDVHYWDVWHGNKPFTDYRNYFFRFVSEFGFQSFPCLKTVEAFTVPEDRNIFSYVMEKHQRNNAANGKILAYLYQTYLYPNDFDTLLYASQLLQAEAIKYGVEHFRRNRGRCMGAIYWQINDCWPVASWASIDYFGRWKALHYFAKRFFSPLLISCEETGILASDTNVNAQPQKKAAIEKSFRLSVANETLDERKVTVKWEIRDKTARVLQEASDAVIVPALSSIWLDKVDVPDIALYDEYVSYHLYEGDSSIAESLISEGTVIFSLPKHFHFIDPNLSYRVEDNTIVINAASYTRSVEIQNAEQDMVLSDNYFDMNAGEKRVKVISGKPDGIKLRSVFDIR